MVNWKREWPVFPIWNHRSDAKLEIWHPSGKIPFECAMITDSLRPALIYYRQRILDAGLLHSVELSTMQFMNWMIGQEPIIQKICGE